MSLPFNPGNNRPDMNTDTKPILHVDKEGVVHKVRDGSLIVLND